MTSRSRVPALAVAAFLSMTGCGDGADSHSDQPASGQASQPRQAGQSTQSGQASQASQASQARVSAELSWQRMSASPLGPRHSPLAVTVGGRVLYIGGADTLPCPPYASCLPPPREPLKDGAAYDAGTDTWTALAAAPMPVDMGARAVVVADRVYVLTTKYRQGTETGQPTVSSAFAVYDAADDAWTTLRAPANESMELAAVGGQVAAFAQSHAAQGPDPGVADPLPADFVHDPAADVWTALPADPHRPAGSRSAYTVGDSVVLLTHGTDYDGNQAPLIQAALLGRTGTGYSWRQLADSGSLSTYGFRSAGNTLVNISDQSADGGETNNWGRRLYEAAALDVASNTWLDRPKQPRSTDRGRTITAFVGGGRQVALGNWLYDVPAHSWTRIPRAPDAIPIGSQFAFESRTPAWVDTPAGGVLTIWGGAHWEGEHAADGVSQLRADGWRLEVG